MMLINPSDEVVNAVYEWCMNAPLDDVLDVRRGLFVFGLPKTNVPAALARRVDYSIPLQPCDKMMMGYNDRRIDPDIVDAPQKPNRQTIWFDLALWSMHNVITRKQIQLEEEKASIIREFERVRSINNHVERLQWLMQARGALHKNIRTWLADHEDGLDVWLDKLITHVWTNWSLHLDVFHAEPINQLLVVIDLTSILMSVTNIIVFASNYPLHFWLRILAGETCLQSVPIRKKCLSAFSQYRPMGSDINKLRRGHPKALYHVAKTFLDLTDISSSEELWLLSMVSSNNGALHVELPLVYPYFYEMFVHRILLVSILDDITEDAVEGSVDESESALRSLGEAYMMEVRLTCALGILVRVSVNHPHRQTFPCVLWTITDHLRKLEPSRLESLRSQLMLLVVKHLQAVHDFWDCCNEEQFAAWRLALGNITYTPKPPMEDDDVDAITHERMCTPVRFAKEDTVCVDLETMIRHFVTRGMVNPFTNAPVTWESIQECNPLISLV